MTPGLLFFKKISMILMHQSTNLVRHFELLAVLVIIWNPFLVLTSADDGGLFTDCGGLLEHPTGVIQSPNFPNPFPTPILCEWIIHAPRSKKIMIYFTQYYLKDHFDVLEYDYYANRSTHVGETKLATLNYEDEIWSVAGHKAYVVLRFYVRRMGNIHLRVLDHLMDVYGFNITYEFADRSSTDIKHACSVYICSYLGNCIVNADFSEYKCQCFPGYFGDECQYGPHCDPLNNKNMCMNNGKCRYFIGAYVNYCECPPGFQGAKCELRVDGLTSSACQELECEQQCVQHINKSSCACNEGFTLNKDNRTCRHIDRYRITVSVHPSDKFTEQWISASLLQIYHYLGEQIYHDLFNKLYDQGMDTMDLFGILGFRNISSQIEFRFFFYVQKYEMSKVSPILTGTVSTGRVGPLFFKDQYIKFIAEPELYISHVATRVGDYDSHPAIQGHDMTLSCVAKGSENIKFKWFKDGALLNPKLSKREAFETKITSSTEEIIRSVLTIDSVSPFDKGEYTCEAADYGEVKNKSVVVEVIALPLVDIDPLSSSVLPGDSVTVRCMSPDDTLKSFKYEWFTDGLPIKSRSSAFRVEDLSPTGIRLYIEHIRRSANFTCRVTNEAGAVNVTAHLYVPKRNETSMLCNEIFFKDVMWRRTGGNHFDKQRCPTETGGYATRKCVCGKKTNKCEWAYPNFASCQSLVLVQIYDQIEMLRLGYQHTTLKKVFDALNTFVITRRDGLYSGDVEMAGSILLQILRHLRNFPVLVKDDNKISTKSIIRLMDLMLLGASGASYEEKQTLHIGTTLIKIADLLSGGITKYLNFSADEPISSDLIDMQVRDARFSNTQNLIQPVLQYSQAPNRKKRNIKDVDLPMEDFNRPVEVIEFTYRKLDLLLRPKAMKDSFPTDHSLSDIHSVYLFPSDNYTFKSVFADIPVIHKQPVKVLKPYNLTECLSWKFDLRQRDYGAWKNSECSVQQTFLKHTICRCRIPGHFLVVTVQKNITMAPVPKEDHSGVFVLVGCIVLMCGVAATLCIYLLKWRQLVGGEYLINLNFLICLLSLTCVCLVCLHQRHIETVCIVCRILMYFFFLGAFSFLLTESIHLFILTNNGEKMINHSYKYMLIGWCIPFILTCFFVLASEIFGKDKSCSYTCWIEKNHWQFYGFVVPVAVIVLLYLIFMTMAFRTCCISNNDWRFNKRRKVTYGYGKSLTVLGLLSAISLLSVGIHDQRQTPQILLLLICELLLSLFIFIFRCILDKQLLIVFWKMERKKKKKRREPTEERKTSSSFRTFIKPERLESDTIGKEQDSLNEYCDKINMMNFTKERKEHLSSLLGSSSNSRNTLGSIINSTYMMRQEMNNRNGASDTFGTDSGIYVGSENEKFLSNISSDSVNQISPRNNGGKTLFLTHVHVHNADHSAINQDQTHECLFEEGNPERFHLHIKDNYVIKSPRTNGFSDDDDSSISLMNKRKITGNHVDKEEEPKDELSILLHSIDHDD